MKLAPPNYFQTPNDLVDHWLPLLGEAELKVLLLIIRKTFGWHKDRDRISLSQMEKYTGMTRAACCKAINLLIQKGIILKEIEGILGTEKVYYSLIIQGETTSIPEIPPQYPENTPPSIPRIPTKETLPKDIYPKEKYKYSLPASVPCSSSVKEEKQAFKDNVFLTQKQHDELIAKHNAAFVEKCYECLSLYKHSKGIDYKSDYHAILKWVIEAIKNDSKPSKSIKIEKSDQDTPEQRKAQGGVRINSKMWAHYAKKGHNMEGYILDENA